MVNLDRFWTYQDNWDADGTKAPKEANVRLLTEYILNQIFPFVPDRVVPSAEGGLGLVFFAPGITADFEILNDGEVTFSVVSAKTTEVWQICSMADVNSSKETLREVLNG